MDGRGHAAARRTGQAHGPRHRQRTQGGRGFLRRRDPRHPRTGVGVAEGQGALMMNRICRRLVTVLCRTLEPDEQVAVAGDLTEAGATDARALRDVFGLVLRRQAMAWTGWRPWLALLGLVLIARVTLGPISLTVVGSVGFQLWNYAIDGTHVNNGLTPGEEIVFLLIFFLALLFWSWTWGFVLGSLSGRAIWSTGALFCAVMIAPLVRGLLLLKSAFSPEMLLP